MSSVRSVRVDESRINCAFSVEMCDWVCEARVERDGCWDFGAEEEGDGRFVLR